tara:strand:+ start:22546 stop:22809 length:264 start_codon:yes stop_codon:yes gene_type:complete
MKVKRIDGVYTVESKYDIVIEMTKKLNSELSVINKTIDRLAKEDSESLGYDMHSICYLQGKAEGIAEAMKPMIRKIEELYDKIKPGE